MDLNNNDELELEVEIEEVPQVGIDDEVIEAVNVEEIEVAEEPEAEELVKDEAVAEEEPDLILDEEPEIIVPQVPSDKRKKEPEVIIPDNKVGSYEKWRDNEKRRSGIIMVVCSVIAIVAVVALIILIPKLFGKGEGTSASVLGEETTKALITDGEKDNATEAATEETTEVPTVVDTVAPVITGVKDKTFNIGDVVMYLSGVSATDDVDGDVEITVDKSAVNVNKAGSYKVKYTATDKAGNSVTAEATFTFKIVIADGATYQDMAKQLVGQIVDKSMSDGQKIRAIYDYLYKGGHMRYTQLRVPGGTWQQEAAVGLKELLTTGSTNGNCIMYASLSMALLEAAGAQVRYVDNAGSAADSHHVWVMCNIGTGWYHFDTTRYVRGGERFMCTETQLQEWMKSTGFKRYYWDKSVYPTTATEAFTY